MDAHYMLDKSQLAMTKINSAIWQCVFLEIAFINFTSTIVDSSCFILVQRGLSSGSGWGCRSCAEMGAN